MNTSIDVRPCVRCGEPVRPRRALIPKFCPECGQRMAGPEHWRPDQRSRRADGALTSLFLGMFSFCAPPIGVLLGTFAILIAMGARSEIKKSGGQLTGTGYATAGLILGILGVMSSIGFCARL